MPNITLFSDKNKTEFWTNAKIENVRWIIDRCCENGVVRKDLIRQWDKHKIKTPVDWVKYHLERNGYLVLPYKKGIYGLEFKIVELTIN